MKFDMIILDIDGTLWDTTYPICDAINYVLSKHNEQEVCLLENVIRCQGSGFSEAAKITMPFLPKETREAYLLEESEIEGEFLRKQGGKIYEGVKETIELLSSKYKLAIISSCLEGYIETTMDMIGITPYISDFIAAEAQNISKAEAMKIIKERNRVEKVCYVGDTEKDMRNSIEAGASFIFASYGFGKNVDAKYKIASFKDLPKMLEDMC